MKEKCRNIILFGFFHFKVLKGRHMPAQHTMLGINGDGKTESCKDDIISYAVPSRLKYIIYSLTQHCMLGWHISSFQDLPVFFDGYARMG